MKLTPGIDSFQQLGAGSATRSFLDKLRERVSVKDKGAIGNGSTNDATAIDDTSTYVAIDGGDVVFTPGTYRVSSDITFPDNVRLSFDAGAKLSIDSGKVVTINGPIDASSLVQIFSGLGTVVFPAFPSPFSTASVTVYPQWWGAIPDGITDNGPALESAINSGARRILLSGGSWGIGTPVTITVPNFILEGVSRVYTDIFPLAADIHVGSGANALFVIAVNTANCIIRHIRWSAGSVGAYPGWCIWAEEGVKSGQCLFSSIIENCWIAMGTASSGFFHGGMNDCWFMNNDIEGTRATLDLQGTGIAASTFANNHLTACVGPFITCTANASNIMQVDGLYVSSQQVDYVFKVTSGANWQINNVYLDYEGNASATIGGLGSFTSMTQGVLTNFIAERGAGSMAALVLSSCQMKISDGYIAHGGSLGVVNYTVNISGASDLDIDNVSIADDFAYQIGLAGSGDIRINGSRFTGGAAYIVIESAGGTSYNLTINHSDLLNGAQSSAAPLLWTATSGRVIYRGNTIGITGGLATAHFHAEGSGTVSAIDNTFIGGINRSDAGTTQLIKLGDAPGFAAIYHSVGMPSTGSWVTGDIVTSMTPSEAGAGGSKYIIAGWIRVTTGSGNVLNTDWFQMRTLTGN